MWKMGHQAAFEEIKATWGVATLKNCPTLADVSGVGQLPTLQHFSGTQVFISETRFLKDLY